MLTLGLLLAATWAILDVHKGRLGGAAFALACGAYLVFSYSRVRRHGARRLDVPAEFRRHEMYGLGGGLALVVVIVLVLALLGVLPT
jgi:Ca2+/Na+ antiporter